MKVLALPGFIGLPGDLQFLQSTAPDAEWDFLCVSSDVNRGPSGNWNDWTQRRVQELRKWKGSESLYGMGYSLGGRLLLSLANQAPDLFEGLVFLSVNPGLGTELEKKERLQNDEAWAQRFETENWPSLMAAWNAQKVFQGSATEPMRNENHFSRSRLAAVLREFSLGYQPNFQNLIRELNVKQLWMAGEQDEKFVSLLPVATNTTLVEIIPNTGHRIHVNRPQEIHSRIQEFLYS